MISAQPVVFAKKMRLVEDLMYYDGPLISHYTAMGPSQFITLWAGCPDDNTCLWYVISISVPNLKSFLKNKMTVLAVLQQSEQIFLCKNHYIDEHEVASGVPIKFEDIPADELPSPTAFLYPTITTKA